MSIPSPHINATKEQIAKTVLMPGDPLRAKFIADTFLTDAVLVNNVRGVQGHTGFWKGVPVTVMASGMGIPSIGIYSWELYHFYDVDNIIRIGSAGALQDDLKLRDLVAGQAACTNSNYVKGFGLGETATFAPIADYTLLSTAVEVAKEHGLNMRVGNLLSSDPFYAAEGCGKNDQWKRMGVLAVEMEAAGLYANAAYAGKRALAICTISDHIYRPEENLPAEDRQNSFTEMMEVALDTAVRMAAL
ncbi:MAG: purine-nucleoside phosphorylase [Oscillospiraceae bacterium]|nr:purine-nucleoside phosphorylase [Oscillospiraceae bacterium]MBR2799404.1 purine-nucleoside phosphorylase [Oscillospiraceae bacterium]MBR3174662.1 purine-nucleoside phosphorylase [Oscillospiraceae bacterium]MBR4551716.1 purine-nucleoside phosphorylase [Oscillospiraceae bacterium]